MKVELHIFQMTAFIKQVKKKKKYLIVTHAYNFHYATYFYSKNFVIQFYRPHLAFLTQLLLLQISFLYMYVYVVYRGLRIDIP